MNYIAKTLNFFQFWTLIDMGAVIREIL